MSNIYDAPVLDTYQEQIIKNLDSEYRSPEEIETSENVSQDINAYNKAVPKAKRDLPLAEQPVNEYKNLIKPTVLGSGAHGGFVISSILAALLPGLISTGVNLGSQGISALIARKRAQREEKRQQAELRRIETQERVDEARRREREDYMNARTAESNAQQKPTGTGKIYGGAMMEGGRAFNDFMTSNKDKMMEIDERINSMKGRSAMNEIITACKDAMPRILLRCPSFVSAVGRENVEPYARHFIGKMFPKDFRQIIKKPNKGSGNFSGVEVAKPMILGYIRRVTGNAEIARKIYKDIRPQINGSGMMYAGGKINFSKIKDFARRAIRFTLPFIRKHTGQQIDKLKANDTINTYLNKYKVFDHLDKIGLDRRKLADLGNNAISNLANTGFNKLDEVTKGEGLSYNPVRYGGISFNPVGNGMSKKKVSAQITIL